MLKLWLLNSEEEITKKLKTISAIHTSEVNGANTLDFECYEAVEKGERVIYQDEQNKWHEFIVQEVTENKLTNVIYAEHSSYELRGDFVEDKRPTGNANVHLAVLLENTRWTIGTVDGLPSKFLSYYRQDVYKSINVMVELFQAYRTFEITVVGNKVTERKVNIKKNAGYDNGKRFVYSKDLIGVERTVLIGDVVTAIYGFGKGEEIGDGYGRRINFSNLNFADSPIGQMFIGDEVARQEFGRNSATGKKHVFTSVEFDDIEDTTELYHATKAKLQELNKPRINYKANVILLEEQFENVDLGDNVSIIDENFRGRELRIEGQVFRVQKDLIDKTKSVVELGNYIEDLADSNKELIQYIKDFRDKAGVWDKSNAFDKDGQLQGSYIKDLLGAWNDLLNGSNGFVYAEPGEGIITYDRAIDDNPTSAIQIVGGGFRIANSKLPNGQWDWKTIGTGEGLAGEHIIANSITANQLRSDVGASLDLSSNDSISLIVKGINTKIENVELTPGPPGKDGRGIVSTEIKYQASTSATTKPNGPWVNEIPSLQEDQYLWTQTTLNYTSGSPSVAYSIGKIGASGADGANGKGITTTIIEYIASTNGNTIPTTGTWKTAIPPLQPNEYLWTRTTINYTTGSPSFAYSVGKIGKDGETGEPVYTWIKYADTPTTGMDDNPTDKKYIGMAFNKPTATESTSYGEYQWSLMPQNIEIGGRNLALGTSDTSMEFGFHQNGTEYRIADGHLEDLFNGGKYTASVYIDELSEAPTGLTIMLSIRNANGSAFKQMRSNETFYVGDTGILSSTFDVDEIVDREGKYATVHLRVNSNLGAKGVYRKLKLERGNVATDWTPAPEDTDSKIGTLQRTTKEHTASIESNSDGNRSVAGRVTTVENNYGKFTEEVRTDYLQKAEIYDFGFIKKTTAEEMVDGKLQTEMEDYREYIQFRTDENDEVEIMLGASGTDLMLSIKKDRMEFKQGTTVLAYFSNNKLHVNDIEVKDEGTLKIGNFEFKPLENKSLSFGKVG